MDRVLDLARVVYQQLKVSHAVTLWLLKVERDNWINKGEHHASVVDYGAMANQFPIEARIRSDISINAIKKKHARDELLQYCPVWSAAAKKGRPKKDERRKTNNGSHRGIR